jgi:hypothetical protein
MRGHLREVFGTIARLQLDGTAAQPQPDTRFLARR